MTQADDECDAIARDLGDKYLLVMRNHGLLAAGRTIAECFYYLYYLEMACKIQVDALASGRELVLAPDSVVQDLFTFGGAPENFPLGVRVWPSMMRMLDRKDPSYKQ